MNRSHTSQTAILVFAQSAKAEARHKAIARAGDLFDVMTARTLKAVEKTGLPYFHFSETHQIGDTFGARFTNAIQEIYDKGFQQVIAIGNDSPQLRAYHIKAAESQMAENKLVLGPSKDGGFYLMGLHREQFDPLAFQELAWQTTSLSKQLLKLVAHSAEVFRLPTLFDIDTVADIKAFVAYAFRIPTKLLGLLLKIMLRPEQSVVNSTPSVEDTFFKLPHNKGSPVVLQTA